ncbi:MAG: ribosome-associated protein [Bacteriovoracaceae bacterium]|jgi:ribosome-associated protein
MSKRKIPMGELEFSFSRSSGAGGQNVNKVNTKVTMRWNIAKSTACGSAVKERFKARYKRRILDNGIVQMVSQRYRSQARNIDDCVEKINEMLDAVRVAPKRRVATKPTRGSVERRIKTKKNKSETKKTRQKVKH